MSKSSQQRETIKRVSPPWLATGVGEKLLYSIGLASDCLLERMNQAVKAHFPTYCDPSALPLIGRDRVLTQGVSEAPASFGVRLKKSFDAWQRAGSRFAVFAQTVPYLAPTTSSTSQLPVGAVVCTNGTTTLWDTVYTTTPIGAPTNRVLVNSVNWNWDGVYQWWRTWLVLYYSANTIASGTAASLATSSGVFVNVTGLSGVPAGGALYLTISGAASSANNGTFQVTSVLSSSSVVVAIPNALVPDANDGAITWSLAAYPSVAPGPVWGSTTGPLWGDTPRSWGLSVPAAQVTALRNILALWKGAGTYYSNIIFAFDGAAGAAGSAFSPYSSQGSGNPDGTWGSWAKTVNGISVASRTTQSLFDCFADGTG